MDDYVLAISNTTAFEYLFKTKTSFSWEIGIMKSMPLPVPTESQQIFIANLGNAIYDAKASWDTGNETSTSYVEPWVLREDIVDLASSVTERLAYLAKYEAKQTENIQRQYAELNDHVYRLYGINDSTRATIKETLGERPPEIIWPQMEKRDAEQKRMEHVWRLLSYFVKRVVAADEDGIVPFASTSGEPTLLERIHGEIEQLFPHQAETQTEAQIVNELRRRVKGYRRSESIAAWLEDAFFDYHVSLYERRPVIWHIASCPTGEGAAAFGALVDYHRFDRNGMAKLRGTYLRDHVNHLRREAALASQEGRREDQIEMQAKLEEATTLDERLRLVQEGRHEGEEGDERDFRILTPWKSPQQRPVGWNPDIDDGVKVNIEPLQKAGVLRIAKVI
jgi:hypothetical protein